MEPSGLTTWLKRLAIAAAVAAVLVWSGSVWVASSVIERDVLLPVSEDPAFDLEIATAGSGRVVLTRTPMTERPGVWGLASETGYGVMSGIVEVRDEVVERGFRQLEGEFEPGDVVRLDAHTFPGDPRTAHGIAFQDVRIAGEDGAFAAWQIEGDRDTWVVVVHGLARGIRREALRIIPALHDDGFPILVITYRNDAGAPPSRDGRYHWGAEEWRDLEAAARFALLRGAEEIVFYGYSMGGSIVAGYLHESELVDRTAGIILDSPFLDLEAAVETEARERSLPGIVLGAAKTVATLRFDLEWRELDQVDRAPEFDVPVLLLHGSADELAPVASSDAFAEARPDLVTYERFDGAGHTTLWNEDPGRYEAAVRGFLLAVAEAREVGR